VVGHDIQDFDRRRVFELGQGSLSVRSLDLLSGWQELKQVPSGPAVVLHMRQLQTVRAEL
jgi:hypothetical protein